MGSIPGQGTSILQAVWQSWKKKERMDIKSEEQNKWKISLKKKHKILINLKILTNLKIENHLNLNKIIFI